MTTSRKKSGASKTPTGKAPKLQPRSKAEWIVWNLNPTPDFPMPAELEAQVPSSLPGVLPRSDAEFYKALAEEHAPPSESPQPPSSESPTETPSSEPSPPSGIVEEVMRDYGVSVERALQMLKDFGA